MQDYEKVKGDLEDWYKEKPTDKIWWTSERDSIGTILFSFDKKTVYNFFEDWDKLTEEQKAIVRKENPDLAKLKD